MAKGERDERSFWGSKLGISWRPVRSVRAGTIGAKLPETVPEGSGSASQMAFA